MPEIYTVKCDREEEEIDGDNAARGLAADEGRDATALTVEGRTFVEEIGAGGQGLKYLTTKKY